MNTRFRFSLGAVAALIIAGIMMYFAIKLLDIPLIVISAIVLISLTLFIGAAMFLYFKSKLLSHHTTFLSGEAGQPLTLTITFNFPWPIIFFSCKLKECENDLYVIRSDKSFLGIYNQITGELTFKRRGCGYITISLIIASPANLFEVEIEEFVYVFHRIMPLKLAFSQNPIDELLEEGSIHPNIGVGSGDPLSLRPYHPGDPMKRIAWKIFAKRRELIIRELERSLDETETVIILADPLPTDEPLANIALEIRKVLGNNSSNLWFGTTVSGELYQDQDRFLDEILASGFSDRRIDLRTYINSIHGMLVGSTVVLLISDSRENSSKVEVVNSLEMLCNLKLLVAPKLRYKTTLESFLFYQVIPFEISNDRVFSRI